MGTKNDGFEKKTGFKPILRATKWHIVRCNCWYDPVSVCQKLWAFNQGSSGSEAYFA